MGAWQQQHFPVAVSGKAKLDGGWESELYASYDHNANCGLCRNTPNSNAIRAQLAAGAFNPFRSDPLSAAQLSTMVGADIDESHHGQLSDAVLRFNGPATTLPGGQVKAAIGAEASFNSVYYANFNTNDATNTLFAPRPPVDVSRTLRSEFAGLYVPLVGSENALPAVRSLFVSIAGRHDRYSDEGSTTRIANFPDNFGISPLAPTHQP